MATQTNDSSVSSTYNSLVAAAAKPAAKTVTKTAAKAAPKKVAAKVAAKPVAKPAVKKAVAKKVVAPKPAAKPAPKKAAAPKAAAKTVKPAAKPASKPAAKTSARTNALKQVAATGRKNATAAVHLTRDASLKLIDSQRAVWLAGLGALAKANTVAGTKGEKAFEALVKAGESFEAQARNAIESNADRLKKRIDGAAGLVDKNIDRFSKTFDAQVEQALGRLGFPKSDAFRELFDRLSELSKNLETKVRGKFNA